FVAATGEDDHIGVDGAWNFSNPPDQLEAGNARHVAVGDHQVKLAAAEAVPGVLAVIAGDPFMTPVLELALERHAGNSFVFGDQDAHQDLVATKSLRLAIRIIRRDSSALTLSCALDRSPLRPIFSTSNAHW